MGDWTPEKVSAATAIVMAVLTAIYAYLTYYNARLTRRTLEAQTDPCVIVYVENDATKPLLDIVIENVGKGLARDVHFDLIDPIPICMTPDGKLGDPINFGPLVDGIPALPPGGKRILQWGLFEDVQRFIGDKKLRLVARFRRSDQHEEIRFPCVLECKSLAHNIGEPSLLWVCHSIDQLTLQLQRRDSGLG